MKIKRSPCNIRAVAKRAGVSPSTVSRVLNGSELLTSETRARVLEVVQKLNYQPNPLFRQAFRSRKLGAVSPAVATQTIGLFTCDFILERARRDDGYYSRVFAGVQQACQQQGYDLLCSTAPVEILNLPDIVTRNRVDGLLVEGGFNPVLRQMLAQRVPTVFIDYCYGDLPAGSTTAYVDRAVQEILDYLWELGHRNAVTFQSDPASLASEEYQNAFRTYFSKRGQPLPCPELCRGRAVDASRHAEVMADYARQVVAARPRPTAVVTWDVYACSLIVEFQRLGLKVPDDISVIGMDDMVDARVSRPQLTSYRFPMDEMGRSAAELLIQHLQDRTRPFRHVRIRGQLIERASCAAARGTVEAQRLSAQGVASEGPEAEDS